MMYSRPLPTNPTATAWRGRRWPIRTLARLGILGLLIAGACRGDAGDTDGASAAGWEAVVDTVGDTVTVRTRSGSAWGDTASLLLEISIGTMEGADEYVIGDPAALAVGPDGVVYVLDVQVPVLRAYAPDGSHLRDVGRSGEGPGEYASPDGVAVLPDGRVLVRDPPNARITVFGPDGAHLGEWPLSGGFNTDRRFYVDTAGRAYVTTLLERGMAPWEWEFGLVRYSTDGEIEDTLAAPTWDYEPPRVTASRGTSSSARRVPFTPDAVWSFSPLGYFVAGLSTDYRIDLYRRAAPVLRVERSAEPVPVNAAEAEERVRRITEGLRRQYGSWRWNGPDVPGVKPPFRELFVSAEGNLWVVVSREGVPRMTAAEAREEEARSGRIPLRFAEPPAFDVFAPDGTYLGHVTASGELRLQPEPVVIGDRLWAVTRDELDVASVARFRIRRP